jgi:hypothetical protein
MPEDRHVGEISRVSFLSSSNSKYRIATERSDPILSEKAIYSDQNQGLKG